MNFTYETTYEDKSPDGTVRVSAEVRLTYTVTWGCAARIHYSEHDYPAEGDELEISKIEIEADYTDITLRKILNWRSPTQDESDILEAWAKSLREEMLKSARDQEDDEVASAKELATAERVDLRGEEY